MLQELANESEKKGLKMNKSKIKVMMEKLHTIYVNKTQIENFESYIYLHGHRYSIKDKNQDKEIQRSITTGWTAFAKQRNVFKGSIETCLER